MKLLTFYSQSHSEMYKKYFLASFQKHLIGYELHAKRIDQISPSGEYKSKGWDLTMLEKIDMIIETIDLSGEAFIYADCDVQFFGDILHDLGNNDIMFQQDYFSDNYCAGFFIAKQNKAVLDFFVKVKETFIASVNEVNADQSVINRLLRLGYPITASILPANKYWTVAFATDGAPWNGQDINVPSQIVMHHANFTIGVENKMALLEQVKNKLQKL
jgi:hypothetical protein